MSQHFVKKNQNISPDGIKHWKGGACFRSRDRQLNKRWNPILLCTSYNTIVLQNLPFTASKQIQRDMDEPNALSVWKCTIIIRRASMLRNPGKSTEEIQLGGGEAGAASGLAAAADNTWHWLANKEETNSSSVSTSFPDFNKTFTDTNLLTPSPPSWLNLMIVQSSLQMMA